MNAHKMQQPYILFKADNFQFGGHFHALQSLENVQPSSASESLDSKKRNSLEGKRQKPLAMSRRNARERRRVKLINLGYETLRHHVPAGIENKKLSKVETLRSAVNYIKYLQNLLQADDPLVLENSSKLQQIQEGEIKNVSDEQPKSELPAPAPSSRRSVEPSEIVVKEERLERPDLCLQTSLSKDVNSTEDVMPKEDRVFIDIAKWLCQNSDSIKQSNFKFKGILNDVPEDAESPF